MNYYHMKMLVYTLIAITGGIIDASGTRMEDSAADSLSGPAGEPLFWMQVEYFDFHADGSNPAFEMKEAPAGIMPGMVQTELGDDDLPVPATEFTQEQLAHRPKDIDKWFVQWAPGDTQIIITPAETTYTFDMDFNPVEKITPADTIITDTLYKNIRFIDSIPFYAHTDSDMVTCKALTNTLSIEQLPDGSSDTTWLISDVTTDFYFEPNPNRVLFSNDLFFPLNDKGFGNEGFTGQQLKTNFAFTMVLRNSFIYNGGEELYLSGDDDIWVFIDRKLVIDIGGLHLPSCVTLKLDSLGLMPGETYRFDLFFAERHSTGSSLRIITDIAFAGPPDTVSDGPDDPDNSAAKDTSTALSNQTDEKGGFCGSGTSLAILPLLFIVADKISRRRKRIFTSRS
jgi:fibro-slime domain-containing protein